MRTRYSVCRLKPVFVILRLDGYVTELRVKKKQETDK